MLKHYTYLFFFCFLLLFQTNALAADSTAIVYAKALEAQNNGQHKEAIQLYESLLEDGQVAAALYNNLGLAYHKDQQLGKAILQFERALKIEAEHSDARHNLMAAEQRIEESIPAVAPLFFVRWWNSISAALSSTIWGILFILLMMAVATGLGIWRMNKNTRFRNAAIGLLIFSSLPLIWGFQQKNQEQQQNSAIIIKSKVGLRQEPALASKEIELIFEGVKVEIIEQRDSWVHIRLPNHLIGWLPEQMLERI